MGGSEWDAEVSVMGDSKTSRPQILRQSPGPSAFQHLLVLLPPRLTPISRHLQGPNASIS